MKGYGSELEKKNWWWWLWWGTMIMMMRLVMRLVVTSNFQTPENPNFETLKLRLLSCWGHRNRHTQEDDGHNGKTSQIETGKLLGTYKCAHTRIWVAQWPDDLPKRQDDWHYRQMIGTHARGLLTIIVLLFGFYSSQYRTACRKDANVTSPAKLLNHTVRYATKIPMRNGGKT